VLINEGAASASEIVAGALKANDRALVMGHRSFGKGSVQTIFEIGNDSAVKLTIAKYLPAGTMSIQSVGVAPDVELVPKTVSKEHMDLVDDVVHSEKDLDKHLDKGNENIEKAEFRTSYYKSFDKGDDGELQLREYTAKPDVEGDYAVQLARKLLAAASSSSRKTMLKEIKHPLEISEREQEGIIDEQLSKLGIDWSPVNKKKKSLLQIAYNIRRGNSKIKRVKAGSDVDLELTASNIGDGTYGQLVAVGQAESPLLKNLEFVFGKLKPGQQKSWRVPLTIPESMPTQDLMMEIEFHEENDNTPEPLNAVLPVQGLDRPRFAFKYRLIGAAPGKNLASGRDLRLVVTAYNVGKGSGSAETVMTLANKSGSKLFIKKGRAALGAMKPGSSRSSTFVFRIGKDFPEREAKLDLTILDPKTFSILNKEFTLDVTGGKLTPKGNVRYQPPSIALSQAAPQTDKATYTLTGAIRDTDAVRDYYMFVGNKKVAYAANPLDSKEMALNAMLPLEEGNNVVSIAARDKFDLTGHRTIVINRSPAGSK
jgi:carboxyl-terminal processing protease